MSGPRETIGKPIRTGNSVVLLFPLGVGDMNHDPKTHTSWLYSRNEIRPAISRAYILGPLQAIEWLLAQ